MPMNSLKSKRCSTLLSLFKDNGNIKLRNKIYDLCRVEIIKCLKATTRKPLTEHELLSMSWDVFTLCVERHSKEEDYKDTLLKAVRTVVNRTYAEVKKHSRERNIGYDEYPEEREMVDTIALRDSLIALKDFREGLPKQYRIIVDDCLASFGEAKQDKQSRIKETKLPTHRYYEAKKVMSWAIEHILGRKKSNV